MEIRSVMIFSLSILLLVLVSTTNVYAGIPEITSCVDEVELNPGSSVQGSLKIKNIGSMGGQFDLKISCNKENIDADGSAGFFKSNEEQTISIVFSGTNSNKDKPLVAICTYTITDRKEQVKDSCSSPVIVNGYGTTTNEKIEINESQPSNSNNSVIPYLIIGIAIIIGFIILAIALRNKK